MNQKNIDLYLKGWYNIFVHKSVQNKIKEDSLWNLNSPAVF